MRKLLFILSALILTGGGLSAQSHGHRQHALKENGAKDATELRESPKESPLLKAYRERRENMKSKSGASAFNFGAAKSGMPDYMVNVIPSADEPIRFSLNGCEQSQSKPIVVKNTSDEPVEIFLAANNAKTELKRGLASDAFGGITFANGYAYGFSYDKGQMVKIDTSTWKVVDYLPGYLECVANCGGTMWGISWMYDEPEIVALDNNMNQTGFSFKIEEDFEYYEIAADGDNILVFGETVDGEKFHVVAYNAKGEKVADYGYIDYIECEALAYNPVARKFWFGGYYYGNASIAYKIENGKLEMSDYFMHGPASQYFYFGFDNNGNGYLSYPFWYKSEQTFFFQGELLPFGNALSVSHTKLSLQPGEQTIVNITANTAEGSEEIVFAGLNPKNLGSPQSVCFVRQLVVDVNAETEYEVSGDSVFTAFVGYETTGTIWLKNTGCQSIQIVDVDLKHNLNFNTTGEPIIPYGFQGSILPGDSLGVNISFYSESAGNFTDSLGFFIIEDGAPAPVIVPLKGTASALDIKISKTNIDTTLTDCADILTIADTITNNTNVPVTIAAGGANVNFKIHTGDDPGYVVWRIYDAQYNTVYEMPEGSYDEYYTDYSDVLNLPVGTYTLYLNDYWWYGGHISAEVAGETIVPQTTQNGRSREIKFEVKAPWSTTVAAKSSVTSLSIPANIFDLTSSVPMTLNVFAEGVDIPVGGINIKAKGGKAELAVASSFDLGSHEKGSTIERKLTLYNNGCAPFNIMDMYLIHGDNFSFDGGDGIAPYGSIDFVVNAEIDSVGQFADTLVIWTYGSTDSVIVALSATGIGAPKAVFPNNVVKDTVDYGTALVTASTMVYNDKEAKGDLIITEPICIAYNAGSKNYWFEYDLYNADMVYIEYFDDNRDYNKYINGLEPGGYKLFVWGGSDDPDNDSYISIISGNDTIAGPIMAKDILSYANYDNDLQEYVYNFTLTTDMIHCDTIAPGDSLPLSINVPLRNWWADTYWFDKYFLTNDPANRELELDAEIKVNGEPNIVTPQTIDFGNVQLGMYNKQTVYIANTGTAGFYISSHNLTGTSFSYELQNSTIGPADSAKLIVTFTPTAVGAAQGQFTLSGDDKTFTIALSGTGVAVAEPQYSADTVRVTAECGQTVVNDTVTVTSSGFLQLATTSRLDVFTGTGTKPNGIYIYINRWDDKKGWYTVKSFYQGTFTVANTTVENYLDLPAGHYYLQFRSNKNEHCNTDGWVSLTFNGETLINKGKNTNTYSTNYYFDIPETYESAVVEANSSTDIIHSHDIEGLTAGEYTYTRILQRTNNLEVVFDTLVTVVTVEEKLDYAYNKDTLKLTPAHVGDQSFATVKIENTGCVNFNVQFPQFVKGEDSKFEASFGGVLVEPTGYPLKMGKDVSIFVSFSANEPGIYRDTLVITTPRGTDSIPVVATASATQIIAASPAEFSGYYKAGDTIAINITFDGKVAVFGKSKELPKILMNTGSFAVADSSVFDTDRDNIYTLVFNYVVKENDNIALLDYAEDSIHMVGDTIVVWGEGPIESATLPALGTFASLYSLTLDNIAPTFVCATSAASLSTEGTITIAFSEEVEGLGEEAFTVSEGAALASLTTNDNATYTAVFTLPQCKTTTIGIAANVADLAGNTAAVAWTGSLTVLHDYANTVVAPTCTEKGYTAQLCSICNHKDTIDYVDATGHKADSVLFENIKLATCTEAGSYDSVVYCSVCKTEISRTTIDTPANGHKADSVVIENVVVATHTATGSYDSVVYCSICHAEISRKTIVVDMTDIISVAVSKMPNKLTYKVGEKLDVTGGKLKVTFSDSTSIEVDMLAIMVSGFDATVAGKQSLTISYTDGGKTYTATFDIEVEDGSAVAEEAAAAVSIYAFDNTIVVEAAEALNGEIAVFDLNGRMVAKSLATGSRTEIQMPNAGIYIVKAGAAAERVVIK